MHSLSAPGIIRTFTGRYINLLEPDPVQIDIRDIAHALSNECRFSGHTQRHYSVAEHSVVGSYFVPADQRLRFLLHDATEAYLKDLPKPLKMLPQFDFYNELEDMWAAAIATRFCIEAEMTEEMKLVDRAMLVSEQRDLMSREPREDDGALPLPIVIPQLEPRDIEASFTALFFRYGGGAAKPLGNTGGILRHCEDLGFIGGTMTPRKPYMVGEHPSEQIRHIRITEVPAPANKAGA